MEQMNPETLSGSLEDLQEICVLANTPNYILSRFKRNLAVRELASTYSVKELIQLIKEIGDPKTIKDLAKAYAYLIAVAFCDAGVSTVQSEDVQHLRWGQELLRSIQSTAVAVHQKNITVPPPLKNSRLASIGGTSTGLIYAAR